MTCLLEPTINAVPTNIMLYSTVYTPLIVSGELLVIFYLFIYLFIHFVTHIKDIHLHGDITITITSTVAHKGNVNNKSDNKFKFKFITSNSNSSLVSGNNLK
jgi:hypothetical protein